MKNIDIKTSQTRSTSTPNLSSASLAPSPTKISSAPMIQRHSKSIIKAGASPLKKTVVKKEIIIDYAVLERMHPEAFLAFIIQKDKETLYRAAGNKDKFLILLQNIHDRNPALLTEWKKNKNIAFEIQGNMTDVINPRGKMPSLKTSQRPFRSQSSASVLNHNNIRDVTQMERKEFEEMSIAKLELLLNYIQNIQTKQIIKNILQERKAEKGNLLNTGKKLGNKTRVKPISRPLPQLPAAQPYAPSKTSTDKSPFIQFQAPIVISEVSEEEWSDSEKEIKITEAETLEIEEKRIEKEKKEEKRSLDLARQQYEALLAAKEAAKKESQVVKEPTPQELENLKRVEANKQAAREDLLKALALKKALSDDEDEDEDDWDSDEEADS